MPAETQVSFLSADGANVEKFGPDAHEAVSSGGTSALTVKSSPEPGESISDAFPAISLAIAKLPVQLDLRVPVPSFRVQDLLSLEKGRVLETAWSNAEDLPLWCGDVLMVWTEFEVIEQKLAVRVTRLA